MVKIITLNQRGVIWNKITVVAATLLVIKKRDVKINYIGELKENLAFLENVGPIKNLTYAQDLGLHR